MEVIHVDAFHCDGLSRALLQWSLEIWDNEATVVAEWFDYDAPDHKQRRTATFPFTTDWIGPLFEDFAAMKSNYDAPITDCETNELIVRVNQRHKQCIVYAGSFVLTEHPEVDAFYRLWNPIEQAALRALDLPFRRPSK